MLILLLTISLASAPFLVPKDGEVQTWEVSHDAAVDTVAMKFQLESAGDFRIVASSARTRKQDTAVYRCSLDTGCIHSSGAVGIAHYLLGNWSAISGGVINYDLGASSQFSYNQPKDDVIFCSLCTGYERAPFASVDTFFRRQVSVGGSLKTAYGHSYLYYAPLNHSTMSRSGSALFLEGVGCIYARYTPPIVGDNVSDFSAVRLDPLGGNVGTRNSRKGKSNLFARRVFQDRQGLEMWASANHIEIGDVVGLNGQLIHSAAGPISASVTTPQGNYPILLLR